MCAILLPDRLASAYLYKRSRPHTTVSVTYGVGVQPRGGCEGPFGRPENVRRLILVAFLRVLVRKRLDDEKGSITASKKVELKGSKWCLVDNLPSSR